MSTKYLSELHKEYNTWVKNLEFCKDELKTFNSRLEEIIQKNTVTSVTAGVEQYQNQFIRQNEVIDELLHDVRAAEHKLVENARENNVASDHRKAEVDADLESRMETFDKLYTEMKDGFTRFMTEVF